MSNFPTANIGLWMDVDDNGLRIKERYVIESSITDDGIHVVLVPYKNRQVNDPKLTRFPDPDLPRWSHPSTIPFSVERFLKDPAANTPNTAELFQDIRALLKEFIWYPADHEFDIIALWIMMTYVYPLFGTLGYLHFNGITGSGKSLSLDFIAALAFNARKTTSITEPALFRLVHANRSTVILDEAEKLSHPKPGTMEATIRLLLNDAYKKGASASRTNMDTGMVEMFETFGPKCLGSINEIDHVFGNRCVVIHSLKKQKDVRLKDYAQNAAEIEARTMALRNRLHCWALTKFLALHQIYTVDLMGALPDLISREREIWLPLITIAHQVDRESNLDETQSLVDILLKTQKEKEKERDERARRENLDILILQTLLNLITGDDRKIYEILMAPHVYFSHKLAEAIHAELVDDGAWPFEKKLTTNRLTNTLKTHHVITESDISRPTDGGKRVRAFRLLEATLNEALRRLQGQEEEDVGQDAKPAAVASTQPSVPPGLPAQTTTHDDEQLPF
ncbi:MAG: hypothetical protein WC326_01650 [Candidatus Delongbacteria bacterium]